MAISTLNGLTNGRVQIAVDKANSATIDCLATQVPANGTVLVNVPKDYEYILEIRLHLQLLKQRQDIQVRAFAHLALPADTGSFVMTPWMRNRLEPVIRLPVSDHAVQVWKIHLQTQLGDMAHFVRREVATTSLFAVSIEKIICPMLRLAKVRGGARCDMVERPTIETREFQYGWEVKIKPDAFAKHLS